MQISRPVHISKFSKHCDKLAANADRGYKRELDELYMLELEIVKQQPFDVGKSPSNMKRNRFTNIIPYDHNRFLLPPNNLEGSDYINASWITTLEGSSLNYIASQGPLRNTKEDFWQMCWKSGAKFIVMLTRCVDNGWEHCHQYWPQATNKPCDYAGIEVNLLNEKKQRDWTISQLQLRQGDEERTIKHFHFTSWPDYGVPQRPEILIQFVRAFQSEVKDKDTAIVHCSAGVGRTGTFICLEHVLQQMEAGVEWIDVFGILYGMRKDRVWMVQTDQQYKLIHECVKLGK